jgi:hypothetical protein
MDVNCSRPPQVSRLFDALLAQVAALGFNRQAFLLTPHTHSSP